MDLRGWSKASADYGRSLLHSGIEGARSGQQEFLNGKSLTPFLNESLQNALIPAFLGVCIGVLGSYVAPRQKSLEKGLIFGVVGGAVGLAAGLAWESRGLTSSVAERALTSIGKVREEHWLSKHPIDYA